MKENDPFWLETTKSVNIFEMEKSAYTPSPLEAWGLAGGLNPQWVHQHPTLLQSENQALEGSEQKSNLYFVVEQ